MIFAVDAEKAARYRVPVLAALGDLPAATGAFTQLDNLAPKPRALAQLDQASVLARSGDLDRAGALAVGALTTGRRYRSERVIQRVRTFRRALPATSRVAAALDESLRAVYTEAP